MTDALECLQTLSEFAAVREEWDAFMERHFPLNYARTHSWLSAWWKTYHADRRALVFIQRDKGGSIVAAAPLLVRHRSFGGFPVRMLQSLGCGIGSDDLLVGPGAPGFARAVFGELAAMSSWHVAAFYRLSPEDGEKWLHLAPQALAHHAEVAEGSDFYLDLPESYEAFLKSRSSKFRNNLIQATKRLQQVGEISVEVLDPFRDAPRVMEVCGEVARGSWQFKAGKSHFNTGAASSFYANLAAAGKGAGGEEFVALLAGARPVAFLFGCRRGQCYYLVDTAFDAEFKDYSVGRILLSRTIERLLQIGGVERFHLEGEGEYKRYYSSGACPTTSLSLYNRSLYARAVRLMKRSRLHGLVKKALGGR